MVHSHRQGIGVSVCVAIVGVGLIVASFATDHWIDSNPKVSNNTALLTLLLKTNDTSGSESKYTGNITFGLFSGYKTMDFSLGARPYSLRISCDTSEQVCAYIDSKNSNPLDKLVTDYKNHTGEQESMEWYGLFSFPMYVTTIVMLALSILFGFLAVGFGIFNVFGRPIETITGPFGLYVWNTLALLASGVAIGVYLGLYFSQLRVNILVQEDIISGFTSTDLTNLDYSFYFVVGAAGVFLINLIVLSVSGQKCSCSYSRSGEKEVDNGMILY